MNIPSIFRSSHVPWVLGAVGTGGVGLAGWYAMDLLPSDDMSIPSVRLENSDCFSKFFPNGTGANQPSNDVSLTSDEMNKAKQKIDPPSTSSSANPSGCMVVNLSYDLRMPVWEFGAQLMLKNENMGLVFYAEGLMYANSDRSSYTQQLSYTVFLMSKESDVWNIKAGYSWLDAGTTGKDINLHIKAPDGVIWFDHDSSGRKNSYTRGKRHYSGIWEVKDGEKSSDVLQGLEVWGKDKEKIELFGRTKKFSEKSSEGYSSVQGIYSSEKSKWFENKDSSFDIVDSLDKWYEPFRTKKGKWVSLEDYCSADTQSIDGICPSRQAETKTK